MAFWGFTFAGDDVIGEIFKKLDSSDESLSIEEKLWIRTAGGSKEEFNDRVKQAARYTA